MGEEENIFALKLLQNLFFLTILKKENDKQSFRTKNLGSEIWEEYFRASVGEG